MAEDGKRFDIDIEEYRRQFESRKEIATPGIIMFMLTKGIARDTLQAQYILSSGIILMLLTMGYQWFAPALLAPPRPTQAQIDEALQIPPEAL